MTNDNTKYNNRPLDSYLVRGRDGKWNVSAIAIMVSCTVMVPGVGIVLGIAAAAGWELMTGKPMVSSSVPPSAAIAKLPKPRPNVTRNDS